MHCYYLNHVCHLGYIELGIVDMTGSLPSELYGVKSIILQRNEPASSYLFIRNITQAINFTAMNR